MAAKTPQRRAVRQTRPDSERFLTLMIVLSHRTFRWSMEKRSLLWGLAIVFGVWALATTGSAYGFWATKKLMSFSQLQRDTQDQQRQLRESQDQARKLEDDIQSLQTQMQELIRRLDPKAPGPDIPPAPARPKEGQQGTAEKMNLLRGDLDRAMQQAQLLRARMEPIFQTWDHTPSIPPTAGVHSSEFGIRISPFSRRNEEGESLLGYHAGLDISNAEGTPIQATAAGVVAFAGWQPKYGHSVIIQHTDELETLYGHMSRLDVRAGQIVNRGDILGAMGRSGSATGNHLHYEVRRNGNPVNPTPYLRLQRQFLSAKNTSFFQR
jgi:murein DD-endopeptidase MepM/ murein hydrolase activator NlpD